MTGDEVRITIRDVYDELVLQGRKLDEYSAALHVHLAEGHHHVARLNDHERRIRRAENWVWSLAGGLTVVAASIPVLLRLL